MTGRIEQLPDDVLREPFRTRDALANGVSPRRLRGRELIRPIRGIRIARETDSLLSRCRAYATHRRTDFAFSHTTAASFYGMPLPFADPLIHVTVRAPGRAPAIAGFAGHKLGRWETWVVHDLPVTCPEQTWIDLAQLVERDALVAAGDFLVSGRRPLSSKVALARMLEQSKGRRGVHRARAALELIREGAESPGETRLRLLLTSAGLPSPVLNHELREPGGRFVARVDFAFPARRIALEYEGDIHRVERSVWQKDIHRQSRIEDLGWRVVRVTSADIADPAELVARMRRLLA
jgi:hypothetical protein